MTYAFDTNTMIDLLNDSEKTTSRKNDALAAETRFIIPPVVDYEIRRGFKYKPYPKKEKAYYFFTQHFGVGEMINNMWVRSAIIYAQLRKKGLTVGDADIFIAAFSIMNGYTLVTSNKKHFQNIEEIKFEDWSTE